MADWSTQSWMPGFLDQNNSLLNTQSSFGASLEPDRQAAIRNLIASFSPGNVEAGLARNARIRSNSAMDRSVGAAPSMSNTATGFAGGVTQQGQNLAAGQSAQDIRDVYSPEGQAQMLQAILQAISSGQTPPALGNQLAVQNSWTDLWSRLNEMESRNRGGGIGGLLGTVLGMAAPGISQGLSGWAKGVLK